MNINKNKGMYLESVINNTIKHYEKNKIALFRKLDIPVKIIEINNNLLTGKIYKKSDVDYYGVFQGKFISIEAKQTDESTFYINKIPSHQISFLTDIESIYKGLSLLIIYFSKYNEFYGFPWYLIKNNIKININDKWIKEYKLDLFFPGRIDFLKILTKKMRQ